MTQIHASGKTQFAIKILTFQICVHKRQADSMDPMARIFQEKAMEAIFDAGFHPSELEGTRTGVYIAVSANENGRAWYFDNLNTQTFAVTECELSMIPHRLSYFLKLKGPSLALNTGCSSSSYAIENAYKAIRSGEIDSAIVGATNLYLDPLASMKFLRLGALSKDGACKTFDARADGYVRSEGIAVIVLQKANHCKRVYAQVVHAKTNSDGFKEQGVTFPSRYAQMDMLRDLYEDCGLDRFSLSFVEAHGTGTRIGDPEECAAIDGVLTSGRKEPLLIGSLKSNMGHAETASGLCSIIKCIIGMESGYIPPNLHFKTPNSAITGIVEGRLKVVVEKTALEEEKALMAVNNFGIGGANSHVLLRRNPQPKSKCKDNLPRLVCVSGRTVEAIVTFIEQINANGTDAEYIKLLHEVFGKNIQNHLYRGYTIVPQCRGISEMLAFCPQQDKPLYLAFGELDNWYEIGNELMVLPAFRESILRIQENLTHKKINLLDALGKKFHERETIPVLGPLSVHIAVIHLLNLIDIKPTSSFGYSAGRLVSAYHNNQLTLDETIDCAYRLNEAITDNTILRYFSTTTQGSRILDGNNLLNDENLLRILTEKETNIRNKFKSTECLMNVLTKNGHIGRDINANSVILKIGYVPLGDREEVTAVSLFGNGSEDNLMNLLRGIGSLYVNGHNPRVDRLYPRVGFPVGRGTPMISPYIRWNHSTERFVPQFHLDRVRLIKRGIRNYRVGLADPQWAFISGHIVDGRVLFPAIGYPYMVWETFTVIQGVQLDASRVSLKNCKFLRAVSMPEKDSVDFTVSIAKGSGCFEVTEGNSLVATGTIEFLPENEPEIWNFAPPDSTQPRGRRLNKKEVYRELRIQGYHYSGEFRMIEEYDFDTSTLYVKWQKNWIAFLDNIMQSKLLESDSRIFQVPVWISEINIAAHTHLDWIKRKLGDSEETAPNLTVHNDIITGKIRSGGVTISGLTTRRIARRRDLRRPVLESYEFVPNCTKLDLHTSVRVNIQIIIENTLVRKFKALELIDEFSDGKAELLSPIIRSVLQDQPVVQPFVKILSAKVLDVDIEVENKELETERNHVLVIASKIMEKPEVLTSAFAAVKENGYVISRESCSFDIKSDAYPDIVIITVHKTPSETILLLRKQTRQSKEHYIEVNTSENFSWLEETQNALRRNSRQDLVLYSNDASSGILGLVNCLRKESGSSNVRCVFVMDEVGKFNPNCDHLKKNMAFNVYKDGMWGTFRHLLLEGSNTVEREHCFVNITTKGDLSSLKWTEGPLNHHAVPEPGKVLVYVYYSSLSVKVAMAAVGKNKTNIATLSKLEQGFSLGFSGKDKRGRRVMGYCLKGALTNLLMADKLLTYNVPDAWTLKEAASVPVTYPTMIYALLMRGCMKKGESILVHSGTGAVGQAAIRLALHYGCQVFTTVGSQGEREFIKNIYPQLKDENIGSFHDEFFEQMVQERTNGRGVDIILNSLTEETFVASVRCLAVGGRFLEIGKFNLAGNHDLSMLLFQKQASFHGITMDNIIDVETRSEVRKLFQQLMKEGAVKPLDRHVFKRDEVDRAFSFMDTSKHVGEVLIKIREDDDLVPIPSKQTLHCISRYYCDPKKVFVIVGGLGGFGLELADWLVQRGARKLVLTSRKGISDGYQQFRVSSWESYGVAVKISTALVTRRDGCEQLIQESLSLGRIAAIFNLAVVLEDAVFENQTLKSFVTAFQPKVAVTKHLDDITRTMCEDLRDFVVFSSFICGKGNAGQTNYGMANSAMEQICWKRQREGYPALAIQWGVVGDVGTVAEMQRYHEDLEIAGTMPQSISSCLYVLDTLLTQKRATVVSSVVVARKQKASSMDESIVGTLINILGIRDAKYISLHVTLAELGMDSMTAIEVKSTLEKDFGIFLSAMDLRATTLARLKEMQEEKSGTSGNGQKPHLKTKNKV